MKFMLFLIFIAGLAKSSIWIIFGIIIRKYLNPTLTFIFRRPLPEEMISENNKIEMDKLFKLLGLVFIIIGAVSALIAFTSMIQGNNTFRF